MGYRCRCGRGTGHHVKKDEGLGKSENHTTDSAPIKGQVEKESGRGGDITRLMQLSIPKFRDRSVS